MIAGRTLAHYEIVRPLGKGGMNEVYLADDTNLDRQAVINVLPSGCGPTRNGCIYSDERQK